MKPYLLAMACTLVMMSGCGGTLDNDPTILGFSPELRAEMRSVIKEANPSANADQVVGDYMDKLRKLAKAIGAKSDESGGYEYTGEMKQLLEKAPGPDGAITALINEFQIDLDLPDWTDPLVQEYKAGRISERRKMLLLNTVVAELCSNLAG